MVLPYLTLQYGGQACACATCIVQTLQESDESSCANEELFAALLVGHKMSGKSFRVSDGDWICPDKKYVHDQNTLLLRLQSIHCSRLLHLAMVGLL